jgi:hypothetical protein
MQVIASLIITLIRWPDILPNGHFADGRFADGRLAERTFYRTDILPNELFTNGQLAKNRDIF